MKIKIIIIFLITLLSITGTVSAQSVVASEEMSNIAFLKGGIDPASLVVAGYQRNIINLLTTKPSALFAEYTMSPFRFSIKNSELKTGGILPLVEFRRFLLMDSFNVSAGFITTQNFDSTKLSVGNEIVAGYFGKLWRFAATAEYEKICLVYLKHSDFYKRTYYEDARDGWYYGSGGAFQFGIETGITLFSQYDIFVEVKIPFSERFDSYGGSPLHGNIGLGYIF